MITISQLAPLQKGSVKQLGASPCTLLVDLTAIRQKHGITVAQAAAACGFTYAVWQRLEAGGSPSLDTALRIARFIEMPVEQIWAIVE